MSSRALVVLSSEQLMPNIQSLLYFHGVPEAPLHNLFIYLTADRQRSIEPANKLMALARSQIRHVKIHHNAPDALSLQPSAVTAQIREWQQAHDGPATEWILNATGGLKPMMAGMLAFVGEPRTRVVYGELQRGWFEFNRAPSDTSLSMVPLPVPQNLTDAIPITTLMEATADKPGDFRVSDEPAPAVDFLPTLHRLIANHWDFRRTWNELGIRDELAIGGFPFEHLVVSALNTGGVTNNLSNLKLSLSSGSHRPPVQESDIWINHGGRLYLLDCKLVDESLAGADQKSLQIRDAREAARRFGGLSAKAILLRPNLTFTDDLKALARYLGVEILDAISVDTFFGSLASAIDISPVPEPWQRADGALKEYRDRTFRLPFSDQRERPEQHLAEGCDAILDFEASPPNPPEGRAIGKTDAPIETMTAFRQQQWVAYIHFGRLFFRRHMAEDTEEATDADVMAKLDALGMRIVGSHRTRDWLTTAFVVPPRIRLSAVDAALAPYLGKKLLARNPPRELPGHPPKKRPAIKHPPLKPRPRESKPSPPLMGQPFKHLELNAPDPLPAPHHKPS